MLAAGLRSARSVDITGAWTSAFLCSGRQASYAPLHAPAIPLTSREPTCINIRFCRRSPATLQRCKPNVLMCAGEKCTAQPTSATHFGQKVRAVWLVGSSAVVHLQKPFRYSLRHWTLTDTFWKRLRGTSLPHFKSPDGVRLVPVESFYYAQWVLRQKLRQSRRPFL